MPGLVREAHSAKADAIRRSTLTIARRLRQGMGVTVLWRKSEINHAFVTHLCGERHNVKTRKPPTPGAKKCRRTHLGAHRLARRDDSTSALRTRRRTAVASPRVGARRCEHSRARVQASGLHRARASAPLVRDKKKPRPKPGSVVRLDLRGRPARDEHDQNVMLQVSMRPTSTAAASTARSFQVPLSASLDRFTVNVPLTLSALPPLRLWML